MLLDLFKSQFPSESTPPHNFDRWDVCAALIGLVVGLWLTFFKLRAFYELTYTLDLILQTQIATTWLDGNWFQENNYGYHLDTHTYFLLLPLAILAKPFGAPGLLVLLGMSAAPCVFLAVRNLRLLGSPPLFALCFGTLLIVSPSSIMNFHDPVHGFHLELLIPPLALLLMNQLIQQHTRGAIGVTLIILLIKESTPILIGSLGLTFLIEYFLSTLQKGSLKNGGWKHHIHHGAASVTVLGIIALPILLYILHLNPASEYARGGVGWLTETKGSGVSDHGSLFLYVFTHIGDWFGSYVIFDWLVFGSACTFATLFLRAHLIPLGLLMTVSTWLMQDDLLWAPRFAPSLAWLWIIGILGIASVTRTARTLFAIGNNSSNTVLKIAATGFILLLFFSSAICFSTAKEFLGETHEVYAGIPAHKYNPQERRDAEQVGTLYRTLSSPDEAVIASLYLFRFAHDRNLYWFDNLHWFDRLDGKPVPKWIIWDEQSPRSLSQWVETKLYEPVKKQGRFTLYKIKIDQHAKTD